MKTSTALPLAAGFLGLASAQQYIDPSSVSSDLKNGWCNSQLNSCPLICTQSTNTLTTNTNTCNPDDLTYSCVCSNGLSPNLTEYTQTLPYFICSTWGTQCVSNCGSDNTCSSACRQDHPCGAQSPIRQNTSTLTSTRTSSARTGSASDASATADSSGIYSGLGGAQATDGASSSSSSGGDASSAAASASAAGAGLAVIIPTGQTLGMLTLVGAMLGGFAVLL